ncbi:UDP-glycosyltransferase 708D1-like [Prunus yedoensis var. nudiflora]|uniref:Glycosyltransferase n=1 Tax=Prunus yedoensis var. nudiflora TaxID=2094558 RepID=A0A314Y1W5_PRUYE|nr:UDP-glycosyltransferase 708D1-like [Prunus yedoensis var. nudiflora]
MERSPCFASDLTSLHLLDTPIFPNKPHLPPKMTTGSGSLLRTPETHVALFPSAGMGHLTPFLRLAALLLARNHCPRLKLTLITTHPTVSLAESSLISRFLSAFPDRVTQMDFHLLPLDPSTVNSTDPFWLKFEAIRRSAHLLTPLLSSLSPPPSALIYDVSLIAPVLPVIQSLPYHLPAYILFTSSARMFSLFASYHNLVASALTPANINNPTIQFGDVLEIPGICPPIPRSSVSPLLLIRNSLFSNIFLEDGPKLKNLNGVLINTFEGLEAEALHALNGGKVTFNDGFGLPQVFPVGPFVPCEFEKLQGDDDRDQLRNWLDDQHDGSVVYVSFGSRTALSGDQIREVGDGLVKSGFRFLWVVKEKLVDREEEEEEGNLVIGHELMEKLKGRGLVVKSWVEQGEILGHRAVGGFVSHCGWNSVVEAAWHGVRVLAWPQHGDQKINAEVVERCGLGVWAKTWPWGGGENDKVVVNGEEIGDKIKELMQSEALRVQAARIEQEAKKTAGVGGCREKMLKRLIDEWKKN